VKIGHELKKQLILSAFSDYLGSRGLAAIDAEHFVYMAKQLSDRESPTYERSFKELQKFFTDEQISKLEMMSREIMVPRPGAYATQYFENDFGFPEYFVYDKKEPKKNFFARFGDHNRITQDILRDFGLKIVSVDVPDEINVLFSFK